MTEDEQFDLIRLWTIRFALIGIPGTLSYFHELAAIMFGYLACMIFLGYADLFFHRVSPDDWGKEDGAAGMLAPSAVMFHKAWHGRSPLDNS